MTASLLSASELVSWGVLYYAVPVVLTPMTKTTGWTAATISGAFSTALLASGLSAPGIGIALERFGSRAVMTLGSVTATLGVAAWSQAETLPSLYGAWLLIGLAMAATLYEPAFATIVRHHRRSQRPAILAVTLVGALAATLFQPLTDLLVAARGWRDATLLLATILAAVTLPAHLALPGRHVPAPDTLTPRAQRPGPATTPWRVTAVLALANGATVAVTVHLVAFLVAVGVSASTAALLAGAVGVAKLAGRITAAVFTARTSVAAVTSWTLAVQAASLVLPIVSSAWSVLALHVAMFGATAGALTVLRPWLVEAIVGPTHFARVDGKVQLLVSLAKAAGPLLLGVATTATAGYTAGWLLTAVLVAASAYQLARIAPMAAPRPMSRPPH